MKKPIVALTLLAAVAAPVAAQTAAAESPHSFTGNVALVSDYVFRGISQTQHKPALQGGFDYSHASGFYLGTWASNVAWVKDTGFKDASSLEMDFYGGYKFSFGELGFDVGALYYYYPGDKLPGVPNTNSTELYAGLSWKFLSLKYSHAVSQNLFGWTNNGKKSGGSGYLDLTASFDLGDGWGISGHVGHQKIKNFSGASYTDWKLGVTKNLGFGTVGLAYTGTDAEGSCSKAQAYCFDRKDVSKDRLVLSFSKSF